LYDYVPDARFERASIISTLGGGGFEAIMTFNGILNRVGFEVYMQNYLVSTLKFGDVVVMDILSVRTAKGVLQSIFDKGVTVLFLSRYLSVFNPVELVWSKMKVSLRELKVRASEVLEKALLAAFASITKEDIINYFSLLTNLYN
jgi:transposase